MFDLVRKAETSNLYLLEGDPAYELAYMRRLPRHSNAFRKLAKKHEAFILGVLGQVRWSELEPTDEKKFERDTKSLRDLYAAFHANPLLIIWYDEGFKFRPAKTFKVTPEENLRFLYYGKIAVASYPEVAESWLQSRSRGKRTNKFISSEYKRTTLQDGIFHFLWDKEIPFDEMMFANVTEFDEFVRLNKDIRKKAKIIEEDKNWLVGQHATHLDGRSGVIMYISGVKPIHDINKVKFVLKGSEKFEAWKEELKLNDA